MTVLGISRTRADSVSLYKIVRCASEQRWMNRVGPKSEEKCLRIKTNSSSIFGGLKNPSEINWEALLGL